MSEETVRLDLEPDEIRVLEADSRGRINLGKAHADQTVRVAVEYLDDDE